MKPIPTLLLAAGLLGASYAILLASPLGRRAEVATGYSARVVCACRYVANRSLQSCMTDLEPGTEIARISDSPKTRTVTARVPLLAQSTAVYSSPFGCVLAAGRQ